MKFKGTALRYAYGVKDLAKREDTIELVDECDALVLDTDTFIEKRDAVGTMIGLTATPLKGIEHSSEEHLVNILGIHIHNSRIPHV